MAHVTYDGTPDVQPQSAPPDDYQRLDVNAGAFGEKTAEGAQKIGDAALDVQKFYGKVAADNGTNNTLDQVTKTLYGDPDKKVLGPDGSLVPDTGYFGLRGADAMSARQDVGQHIDEVIRENRSSLSTPESQYQYDVDTRRYRAQWQREMGAHADDQQRIWATDTNNTSAQLALNGLARNPAAEPTQDQIDAVRNPIVKNAQLQFGNTPQVTQGAVLKADQAIAEMRVKSLLETNAPMAEKVFNDNRGILASLPDYDMLSERVKNRATDAQLGPASQSFLSQYTPGSGAAGGSRAQINIANNNPGNLRVPGQNTGFATFPTMQAGIDAVDHQIGLYMDRGKNTIQGIVSTYAPPGVDKNNTPAYIAKVSEATGKAPTEPLTKADIPAVRDAMISFEQGGVSTKQLLSSGTSAPQATRNLTPQNQADYYRSNYSQIVQNADAEAERQRPGDAVYADKFRARVERGMNDYIRQQELSYKANADTVFQAFNGSMSGGHRPTSVEEMRNISPQVSQAWDQYQSDNPQGALAVETRLLTANSRGAASGYGTAFYDNLKRVLAPTNDPDYVSDTSKLAGLVEPGSHGALSNTGFSALQQIQGLRGTPQGEAQVDQIRSFLKTMHGQMTFSNPVVGIRDQAGEAIYSKFLVQALPVLEKSAKDGTLHDMLDPNGKNYLGKLAVPFMRSQTQILTDHKKAIDDISGIQKFSYETLSKSLDGLDNDTQRRDALKTAVALGRIPKPDAIRIAAERHYIQAPPPEVPVPH